MGLCLAAGGWIGVTAGGFLADLFKRRHVRGRFFVCFLAILLCIPSGLGFALVENVNWAYFFFFLLSAFSPMWLGAAISTINDLVLPRMRAVASAFYILMLTFIGLALGPYSIVLTSDYMASSGLDSAEALRVAMIIGLLALIPAAINLFTASLLIERDDATRIERARALGEPV